MEKNQSLVALKVTIVLAFIIMVAANTLANVLPLGGVTTGQVSDSYPNLFAPAGFTFMVWFLIYFLLLLYSLYSTGLIMGVDTELLKRTGPLFILSSLFNTGWIFAWHYDIIWLSLVLMAAIFACLAVIYTRLSASKLPLKEELLVRLPFSVYFGWITIAAVANITTFLVSLKWNGFGISPDIWMIAVSASAALVGTVAVLRRNDIAYGIVFLWALSGILIKHVQPQGFAGEYSGVMIAVAAELSLVFVAVLYVVLRLAFKKIHSSIK